MDLQAIQAAADQIRGVAHRTPVVTSRSLDARVGARVFLKCENLQRGGSFKFRGAYNRLSALTAAERDHSVWAGKRLGHSKAVLEKRMLVQHFMQHYDMLTNSLLAWRMVADWTDHERLPAFCREGIAH